MCVRLWVWVDGWVGGRAGTCACVPVCYLECVCFVCGKKVGKEIFELVRKDWQVMYKEAS